MTEIATATIRSAAPPAAFFARWADVATWPAWNADTEWVRLDGPFEQGATGVLKPRGGPRTRFVVTSLVPGREFVDVSRLLGARLTFAHVVIAQEDGGCRVDVRVSIDGPLRALWSRIIGRGIAETLQDDLDRLAAVAVEDHAAADRQPDVVAA
jgi:hypothetical protein